MGKERGEGRQERAAEGRGMERETARERDRDRDRDREKEHHFNGERNHETDPAHGKNGFDVEHHAQCAKQLMRALGGRERARQSA